MIACTAKYAITTIGVRADHSWSSSVYQKSTRGHYANTKYDVDVTERWDQQLDRKLAPSKAFVSIIPLWIRIGALAATLGATVYIAIEDRQPFRGISLFSSSYNLGFLITWLCFLAPCLVVFYSAAALLHRRRRKQDFPRATVVER